MEIKGIYEKLGIDQSEVDKLREMRVDTAAQRLMFMTKIMAGGGNIHRVDHQATAKRRAANKVARRQRRVNRAG